MLIDSKFHTLQNPCFHPCRTKPYMSGNNGFSYGKWTALPLHNCRSTLSAQRLMQRPYEAAALRVAL